MTTRTNVMRWLAAGLAAGIAIHVQADPKQRLAPNDLPTEFLDVLNTTFQGATIQEVEQATRNGETIYEVELQAGPRTIEVTFAADGTLLEVEQEEPIPVAGLPGPVVDAVERIFPTGTIRKAIKETEDDQTVFEVKVRSEGILYEAEVADNGRILEIEKAEEGDQEIAVSSLPAAVRGAVNDRFPGADIYEAEREVEDGRIVYEVELLADGQAYEVELNVDGEILEIEKEDDPDEGASDDSAAAERHVAASDLPAAVAAAVREAFPRAEIIEAETETEGAKLSYEVEVLSDGKLFEVEVSPDGKVLEVESAGEAS